MAEVLTEDFISSEDTDMNEDGKFVYTVKDLAWESRKLTKRKKVLDKFYAGQHSKHGRNHSIKRLCGEMLSARQHPDDFPAWACENTSYIHVTT